MDKYIRFFQQKATLTPAISDNARPKKMEWWKEAYLEALVRIYPTIYLRELQALLAGDFNLAPRDVPSIPTIARLLTALRITRKKCVHVATVRFSPYNRHCRQLFFQWRRTIDPSRVYFFDETSFNCETDNREYGEQIQGCHALPFAKRAKLGTERFLPLVFAVSSKECFKLFLLLEILQQTL